MLSGIRVRCRTLLTLLVAFWGSGCSITVAELDALNRSLQLRTIVLEPSFSLLSPYSLDDTREYARTVAEEIRAVSTLFRIEIEAPIRVRLLPLEDLVPHLTIEGDTLRSQLPPQAPLNGLQGGATTNEIFIFVPKDRTMVDPSGRAIPVHATLSYRDTVRHEIAHICCHLAGLEESTWFSEGVAEWVDAMEYRDGELVVRNLPDKLVTAASLARKGRPLASVLLWEENPVGIIHQDRAPDIEARLLSYSFVAFLLDQRPEQSFPAALRDIAALSPAELLDQEADWRAWLSTHEASDEEPG